MVRFVEGADGGDGVHEGRNGGGGCLEYFSQSSSLSTIKESPSTFLMRLGLASFVSYDSFFSMVSVAKNHIFHIYISH